MKKYLNETELIMLSASYIDDYDMMEKRGGDAMFATGALGRSLGRMGNFYGGRRAGAGAFRNQAMFG